MIITMASLSINAMSTPRCNNGSAVLNKNSSKIFNTSNARMPKTVALVKRFAVRNGSIGAIKPKQKTSLIQNEKFSILL